jgi:mxaK protein
MRALDVVRRWLPLAVLVLAIATALFSSVWLLRSIHQNRIVAALADGHDIVVGTRDAPELMFARARFFLIRDEFEQAQPLTERVVQVGGARMAADMLYDAGNAHLHHAIQLIENNKFDAATADVVLARDSYTRALRIEPGFWDAKYNLDIAMRLVRDLPDVDLPRSDLKRPAFKLWTDLPGLPKGGP